MVVRGGTIINISGASPVDDPEYRYKMPAVFGKIEGSGNGIKTVIPNITEVALSLHRQPGEVNKFFGTELGAQTRYSAETDRAVVNGAHMDAVLQDLMHRYIERFVLCPNCNLPETDYKIKNDAIWHKCAACGAKEMVDMSHKLCNYILAEDKKAKKDSKKSKKGDKDDKKKKDKKKDKDSDDEKKKKKDKKKSKDKKSKDKKEKNGDDEDEKDYIKEALEGGKTENNGLLNSDDEDSVSLASEAGVDDQGALLLAVEATQKYIAENSDVSDKELSEVVTNQQMASALKSHDKVHIIVRAALSAQFFKNKEIEKYSSAIYSITSGNKIMERHLIASLEALCIDKPKNFPVMIKQFYDEDALAEETILEWADEGRSEFTLPEVDEDVRATLRGEAEPVVVWLQEADSEDDSSDED
jgi:translation initiation factor 5